ncbi:MAG: hypothetical protein ACTHL8_01080 [Burkholderiaceae bacterium]
MSAPVTTEAGGAVTLQVNVANALFEALTMVDSIDWISDDLKSWTHEAGLRAEAIKACTARIRMAAEPFLPAIEAALAAATR